MTDTPKRYRYSAKERDEETGFNYHGARYYATLLGRWLTVDRAGFVDGPNLYCYVRDSPMRFVDPDGHETKQEGWEREFKRDCPKLENVGGRREHLGLHRRRRS